MKFMKKKLYSYIYVNQFKEKNRTKLFKEFSFRLWILERKVFAFSMTYRHNLRTTKDYHDFEDGKKEMKYLFDSIYLTILHRKRYFMVVKYNYLEKHIKFFTHKYKIYEKPFITRVIDFIFKRKRTN